MYVIKQSTPQAKRRWSVFRWYFQIRDIDEQVAVGSVAVRCGNLRLDVIRGALTTHHNLSDARNEVPPSRQMIEGPAAITGAETWG